MTDHILQLHQDLKDKTYRHGKYHAFKINDPKPRDIHKASVRDRLVHHSIYKILYPYFDNKFIFDSYSCRLDKGTHKAIARFKNFSQKVSVNNTRTVWILKGDIKKFFASIDHIILQGILKRYIVDQDILWLLNQLISSFNTEDKTNVGLPLGNLTSQLFVNIYMNEFDQFIKHKLKVKYYIRYADDFVVFSKNKIYLEQLIPQLGKFLGNNLRLTLHPQKLFIRTLASGVDFLGWVIFPHHLVPRTSTKKRMFKRLQQHCSKKSLTSYTGILGHGNTYKIVREIKTNYPDFLFD
ncbi:hypothetical protein A2316_00945 [Candidatus Falkowbacteria bacterium RIFOXYB2_FULL_38_15]|nr:MAG: hypothetical protein A2316_00945 [Candidatus Falkowbacteria bacterium RIFOXYB2_FULL_38_15]OGF42204.1 MAG: hypothetical protein A2555_02950 [Candidatus Falkowbacteria bacterium RIFOXYD2_FULL_39_16]